MLLAASGCGKNFWKAKVHLLKAEDDYSKAYQLKYKKVPYEMRLKYYGSACRHYKKVYHSNSSLFTLNRIWEAADACFRIEDLEGREEFLEFEEKYVKEHPTEAEYGDAVPINID